KFFRADIWSPDAGTLRGWDSIYVKTIRLLIVAIADFRDGVLSIRATSLVSTTLLSLVPLLAVMFSVLKAFGVHQQIEPFLSQALEPLGERGTQLTTHILEFVNNLKVGALGAVGVAGLFYTTYSLIDKIEEALNHIWRVRQPRPLARKFSDYLSVVLVGPVLVFTALATTASAQSHWIVQTLLGVEPLGVAIAWATAFMPFVFICGAFTFLFKLVPNTDVKLASAAVGGISAGILWQLAGLLFSSFVVGSGKYSAVYSGFAILILFFIWLYLGWLIVLVGAQVAYYHQHPTAFLTRLRWKQNTAGFQEYLALTLLVHITRRYLTHETPYQPAELAAQLCVPLAALEDVLDDFLNHRLIYRTSEPRGVTLGRPPDQIKVLEVLSLVNHKESLPVKVEPMSCEPVCAILDRRSQAVERELHEVTLKMLADEGQDALGTASSTSASVAMG
ncbi:MAG: YhjD/YihY/BrkB family envelope integrity protein, partial [Nitrospirota bacterium]|nr:YhjD/YihY/BrkB family envelope integrity protein [Nitrospirota bacterium]